MSTTGGRPPLGDDELGRALSQGLSRALDGDVDPAALVRGARAGAQRIEHRRTVVRRGVGALVVVAMLPLGVTVLKDSGVGVSADSTAGGSAAAAPELASGATSAAASDGRVAANDSGGGSDPSDSSAATRSALTGPGPTAPPGVQYSAGKGVVPRDAGEVVVPDAALLRGSDLGLTEVQVTSDTGGQSDAARTLPTTVVALCGTGPAEASVLGGRAVTWTGNGGGRQDWAAATTVRVFSGTGAADELARLRRAVGTCADSPGVAREPIAGLPGDDVLVAVLPAEDAEPLTVVGVLRRGRVTVGVELVAPRTADPAADRADAVTRLKALLVRADARVRPFAEDAQADPSLG